MPVKVLLSSVLRQYIPGYDPLAGIEFTLDGKMTVSELCKLMNIPQDRVKIVMVNGMSKPFDFVLRGDERVGLFPPLGGG